MPEKIIGRKHEQLILDKALHSKHAEFLAVYGRRRVGKTYLIEQFFCQKSAHFFQMTGLKKGTLSEHLSVFSEKLSEFLGLEGELTLNAPESWMSAFKQLTNTIDKQSQKEKVILFFDELPWLASQKSGFKKALDYYWNSVWSKNNKMILIVCGSAASWMIKNIINDKGGLHNRVTIQMPLYPFNLNETQQYLKYLGCRYSLVQVLELFMAVGGIPHYLRYVDGNLSAAQNISQLCFRKNAPLFKEFDNLFASLFSSAKAYVELVKVIASKQYGVTRKFIESKVKLSNSGGTLSDRLQALEEAGFIRSFVPIGYSERGLSYKCIDEYCLFYLQWIYPLGRQIGQEVSIDFWISQYQSPKFRTWSGYAFESVCLKHVPQVRKALMIPAGAMSGSWSTQDKNGGAQVDLLFDRPDGIITVVEIKYTHKPFTIDKSYAEKLSRKLKVCSEAIGTDKMIFLAMITPFEVKQNIYSQEMVRGVVNLKALFCPD